MDEVHLKSKGKKHWLWRAVDRDGLVLDIPVQERRNQEAAERFLRRVLDGEQQAPRVVVTDTLASYPPALKRVLPHAEHRRHEGLNDRAENSHRPVRTRERTVQRFKSPDHAQRFLKPVSVVCKYFRSPDHAQRFLKPVSVVCKYFRSRRHLLSAAQDRQIRNERFRQWREVTTRHLAA